MSLDPAQANDGSSVLVCAQLYESPYEISPGVPAGGAETFAGRMSRGDFAVYGSRVTGYRPAPIQSFANLDLR